MNKKIFCWYCGEPLTDDHVVMDVKAKNRKTGETVKAITKRYCNFDCWHESHMKLLENEVVS